MNVVDGVLQMGQSFDWLSILFVAFAKSTVVLATAALLNRFLLSGSARVRHMLWCAALFSLFALPLFSGWLQPLRVPILPAGLFSNEVATQQPTSDAAVEFPGQLPTTFSSDSDFQSGQDSRSTGSFTAQRRFPDNLSWRLAIVLVWLIGVLLVVGRFLVGVITVQRLVRRATALTGTPWSALSFELSQQLRLRRPVRLLRSDKNIMPMTCAGLSAVVLLPNDILCWSADRQRVVVLHELIHVKRRDLLTQTLTQMVCALYWFNPLTWWAVRRLRTEQEWACDEHVLANGVKASDYAGHLLEIARSFRADRRSAVTTTAMARSSQLQDRLCAILKPAKRYRSSGVIEVSVVVMGVVFISTAVTRLVTAERQSGTNVSSYTDDLVRVDQKKGGTLLGGRKTLVTDMPVALVPEDNHELHPASSPTPINNPADRPSDSVTTTQDRGDETAEQIFNGFSVEERTRLTNNGIGPAYIKEMGDEGYRRLTVAQLIALFSNAVNADYVAGLRSVGYADLSTADLLALKTNDITPDVIRSFQAVKYRDFKATNYIAFVSNGVTPSYLRSLSAAGYDSLSPKQIVEMHLAGVTPEFIRDARSRGSTNLSPNDLIELKRREKQ